MVKKDYDWKGGAVLGEHSKKKHKILEEYFRAYIRERCKNPMARGFNLAIVDGFAGGGLYTDGSPGSPVILAQTLLKTVAEINVERNTNKNPPVNVKCLMILNDIDKDAIRSLEERMAPCVMESKESGSFVTLRVEYHMGDFEDKVEGFINRITSLKCGNIIYYLDQCGHIHVKKATICKLMKSANSVEVFLTFAIQALLTYLPKNNIEELLKSLRHLEISEDDIFADGGSISSREMLGKIECLVHKLFSDIAPYFSPFAIHNPDGWQYWLMHFVKSPHGRRVYNNVLHANSGLQAHYGRAGLDMLAYNPNDKHSFLFSLFDKSARELSRDQLRGDVVRRVFKNDGVVEMSKFLMDAYKSTAAHSDDIDRVIIESPELDVFTPNGGRRKTHNNIDPRDIIKLKPLCSIFLPNVTNRPTKK